MDKTVKQEMEEALKSFASKNFMFTKSLSEEKMLKEMEKTNSDGAARDALLSIALGIFKTQTDKQVLEEAVATLPKLQEELERVKAIEQPKDGYTPKVGKDFFTKEQVTMFQEAFKKWATSYLDSNRPKDGKDADEEKIIKAVLKSIPPAPQGYTPKKGKDYLTPYEVAELKREVTPAKGVDYFTKKDKKEILSELKKDVKFEPVNLTLFNREKNLGDLQNVDLNAPTNGQSLTYQSSTGKWVNATVSGGSGTPGGSDTQVQFNDGGSFGGDAGLTYNKTTDALTVGGALTVDTDTFVVDATNNRVGIGTASPSDELHVVLPTVGTNSYVRIASGTATAFNTRFGTTASNQYAWLTNIYYDGAAFQKDDATRAGWRMNQVAATTDAGSSFNIDTFPVGSTTANTRFTILGSGLIGIGTQSPGGLLQLTGTSTDTALLGATSGASSNALLNFAPSSDNIVRWGFRLGATANFPLNIDYRDSASGNPTNLVQMTRTGFFGINGTPTAKLHVRESSDSSSVQVAIFEGDRATPTTNDEAYLTVKLSDAAGTQTETARITSFASSVSAGAMTALMKFGLVSTGTLASRMELSPSTLYPTTSDGVSLGSSTKMWSDLFLASGAVINFAASDFTLTHSTGVLTASGSLTAATFRSTSGGLVNNGSSNNARYQPASTGSTIDRNIADSNPCLIVQQVHASSTGDILQVKNNATTVLTIAQTGAATFSSTLSIGTSNALTAGTIELGNASDTTLSRSSAGVLAVEGVVIPSISSTNTLTNKRVTPRTGTTTSSATPTINTDNVDFYSLTAQAADITSFTTNLSGTPTEGQKLWIAITGTAARAITWGSSFEASTVALPTTTVSTNRLDVGFVWNTVTSKWRCVATC